MNFLQGPPSAEQKQPIVTNLIIDGWKLGQVVTDLQVEKAIHSTAAASYNRRSLYVGGDDNAMTS